MPPEEIEELMRLMAMPLDLPLLRSQHLSVFERLEPCDREDALAKIGAMLCDATLQSNCIRLEAFAHIALIACKGCEIISDEDVRKCFAELGEGICGRKEDPAEDVFVSLVHTSLGNYRVLEGIWESGTFYLQRILDVIETFPDGPNFVKLRERAHALLALSDAVCQRVGLQEYQVGQPIPLDRLDEDQIQFMRNGCVVFTLEELDEIGIETEQLDLFTLAPAELETVGKQELLGSVFQRYPVWTQRNALTLAMPTAVSFAIRMAVCNQLMLNEYRPALVTQLEIAYHHLWERSGLLGIRNWPQVTFYTEHEGTPHLEFSSIDEAGAHVHFYFLLDDFLDMPLSGLNSPKMLSNEDNSRALSSITAARDFARSESGFVRGMTLVVFCGIGRGVGLDRRCMAEHDDWNVEFLTTSDFDVLNHHVDFTPVDLFRHFDWRRKVEALGLKLHNNNGLLNLLAFQHSTEGKVVNSNELDSSVREHGGALAIGCNFVAASRQDYWRTTDYRRLSTTEGTSCLVRRIGGNRQSDRGDVAVYAMAKKRGKDGIPIAITLSNSKRIWWGRTVAEEGNEISYNEFEMLRVWLRRCVPVLERELGNALPSVVEFVALHRGFSRLIKDSDVLPADKFEIEKSIEIELPERFRCCVALGEAFWLGQRVPTNIAERAFVRSICKAFFSMANVSLKLEKLELLELEIVPNDDARQVHCFHPNSYRDRARGDALTGTIHFNDSDIELLKLGAAFQVEAKTDGRASILGKDDCLTFLRKMLSNLENELCTVLGEFDKVAFLSLALRNYEAAKIERNHWLRTGRANMAINSDQPEKQEEIVEKDLRANNAILPCRLLIEFGVASCAEVGGRIPGELELSQLMAKAYLIFQFGGWFNAIWWEWMPPKLLITPLGDIHAKIDYELDVLQPYAQMNSRDRVRATSENYEKQYEERQPVPTESAGINSDFEKAFECEFGYSINEMRTFVDVVEDFGQEKDCLVFTTTQSDLIKRFASHICPKQCEVIIDELHLRSRMGYRALPDNLEDEDFDPWRFGRRMSLNRKPIVGLNSKADPNLMLAPGLIRESLEYSLRLYHEAEINLKFCRSDEMRSWHGTKNSTRGDRFVSLLAVRLEEIGYSIVAKENEVTALLGFSKDETLGDLKKLRLGDVDLLVYHEKSKRLLAIECKHLQYKKTPGEIAEQLNDYRGEMRQDGRKLKKDELRKHLHRMEVLQQLRPKLLKRQKLPVDVNLEGWVVFRHPVPMLLCWEKFKGQVEIGVYGTIADDLVRTDN